MKPAAQIPLDLPYRPALSGDDYFVAQANATAIDWVDRWPDWPGPGVAIHGERGAGKSHLLQVFAARSRCLIINRENLGRAISDTDADAFAIDDADDFTKSSSDAAEGLFHLFNAARSNHRKLFLTARSPAARWDVPLKDLMSRLKILDSVSIGAPDDELLSVLLMKQFSDRQIRIDRDVVHFLTTRMERSTAAVTDLVAALDQEALARKQAITVPLARTVLDRQMATRQTNLDF